MKNRYFTLLWLGNTYVTLIELCWYNRERLLESVAGSSVPSVLSLNCQHTFRGTIGYRDRWAESWLTADKELGYWRRQSNKRAVPVRWCIVRIGRTFFNIYLARFTAVFIKISLPAQGEFIQNNMWRPCSKVDTQFVNTAQNSWSWNGQNWWGKRPILIIRASPCHLITEYILDTRTTIASWRMSLLATFS